MKSTKSTGLPAIKVIRKKEKEEFIELATQKKREVVSKDENGKEISTIQKLCIKNVGNNIEPEQLTSNIEKITPV